MSVLDKWVRSREATLPEDGLPPAGMSEPDEDLRRPPLECHWVPDGHGHMVALWVRRPSASSQLHRLHDQQDGAGHEVGP